MKINKEKCAAWIDLFLAISTMTKELTNEECRYIKAIFSIAFGKLELQELENKTSSMKAKKGA